jgi:hypothetical protein
MAERAKGVCVCVWVWDQRGSDKNKRVFQEVCVGVRDNKKEERRKHMHKQKERGGSVSRKRGGFKETNAESVHVYLCLCE